MCTLAVYFQQSAAYPLVVAANRDEFLDRPAAAPMLVRERPWVVAGTDLVAGGTWLGVNEHALVAGILNRRTAAPIDPQRRSRGLLCLETLAHRSVDDARAAVAVRRGDEYNPFNLLAASPRAALVVQNLAGRMAITALEPGLHVLTNLDLNDPTCPRIAKSYRRFRELASGFDGADLAPVIARVREVLSDHSTPLDPRTTGPPNNLCVHLGGYGTRSSSLIVYSAAERRMRFWHAPGPPCGHAYEEIDLPNGSGQS